MLIKRSSKNQVAIPRAVLDSAGLGGEDVYFDIVYRSGHIILTPMRVEEKIPREALERFENRMLNKAAGDRTYSSMDKAIAGLRRNKHS